MVKLAVASTDGKVVNQHFGRAERFFILSGDEESGVWKFLEERKVTPVCKGGDHEDADLLRNVNALSDCTYVLVSRVGQRAERELEKAGIQIFEIPGIIDESIDKMFKYIQIQNLMN